MNIRKFIFIISVTALTACTPNQQAKIGHDIKCLTTYDNDAARCIAERTWDGPVGSATSQPRSEAKQREDALGNFIISLYAASAADAFQRYEFFNPTAQLIEDAKRDQALDLGRNAKPRIEELMTTLDGWREERSDHADQLRQASASFARGSSCQRALSSFQRRLANNASSIATRSDRLHSQFQQMLDDLQYGGEGGRGSAIWASTLSLFSAFEDNDGSRLTRAFDPVNSAAERDKRLANMNAIEKERMAEMRAISELNQDYLGNLHELRRRHERCAS